MRNSFDSVSLLYDHLARVMFGREWASVQTAPAQFLKGKRKILIVGGGSGKILEMLGPNQQVTYLELSGKMIERAKSRASMAQIDFIEADYLQWDSAGKFDAILFPFFLDSFNLSNVQLILARASNQLEQGGRLHIIDFQSGNTLQNFLVKTMYAFFRISTNLEGRRLLDFDKELQAIGFVSSKSQTFYQGWVFYRVYDYL